MEKVKVVKAKDTSAMADAIVSKGKKALREVVKPEFIKATNSVYDQIAGDILYKRNFYYPGGREAFPNAPALQYVDRYYPDAKGGPIAFDICNYLDDSKLSELKRDHLAKAGIKFAIVTPEMERHEILEQLA